MKILNKSKLINLSNKYFFCLICILSIHFSVDLKGQNINISGWVSDSETGERLVGASVRTANGIFQTDNYGFFSIKSRLIVENLQFSYVGYQKETLFQKITKDTVIEIKLRPQTLQEVVVKAKKEEHQQEIGVLQLPVSELKTRPVLFGEPDVIKALALTPGVKQGTEGTTGLFVRGGTPDQNNILLDGATVYNTSHLFGFISVFNPDAIKSVTLYKGKMPSKFGGRLSSVLDIVMKEGDNQNRKTEISIGLISSRFCTEGPIKKNKSSYLFSARSSYLSLLALPTKISYNNGNRSTYANYWMYDVNAKVNFDLGNNSRLFVSAYSGNDNWLAKSRDNVGENKFGLIWGNQTFSLRYNKLIRQKVFFISQATINRYNYGVNQSFLSKKQEKTNNYLKKSFIQDINFKNSVQWNPSSNHTLESGLELASQSLAPQLITIEGGQNSSNPIIPIQYKGLQNALFVEDKITLNNRLLLTAGVRTGFFNTGGEATYFVEPRTNLQIMLDKRSNIELSYRENRQTLHLLTSSGIGLPNDIWVPATANTPASFGRMFSGGYNVFLERSDLLFSLESYYRTMSNLIDFQQGLNFFSIGNNWEDVIEKNGKGRAYGFEFMLQKKSGRLNGWASYTLAWNERKFQNINNGAWFPHQYDRRHEFSVTGNYKMSEKWTAAANFVFTTGNAFTAPAYLAVINQDSQGNADYVPIFLGKNNRRTPVYHRLDLSVSKMYQNKKGRICNLSFGVYNVYAHNNPFYTDISIYSFLKPNTNSIDKIAFNYKIGSIFNFIPSISYAIKL